MKNILIALSLLSLASVAAGQMAGARSPTAIRDPEASKAVVALESRTTTLESRGAVLEAEMDAVEIVAAAAVAKATAAQVTTSAAEIATTAFTPAFVGQTLVATVSNLVWIAGNATTNGWILITN